MQSRLLGGLPHRSRGRALTHIDPPTGELPGPAVAATNQQHSAVTVTNGGENRGCDHGRYRGLGIVEVNATNRTLPIAHRTSLAHPAASTLGGTCLFEASVELRLRHSIPRSG